MAEPQSRDGILDTGPISSVLSPAIPLHKRPPRRISLPRCLAAPWALDSETGAVTGGPGQTPAAAAGADCTAHHPPEPET